MEIEKYGITFVYFYLFIVLVVYSLFCVFVNCKEKYLHEKKDEHLFRTSG